MRKPVGSLQDMRSWSGPSITSAHQSSLNVGVEKYGIEMPSNMPHRCAEISKVLNEFLTYQ